MEERKEGGKEISIMERIEELKQRKEVSEEYVTRKGLDSMLQKKSSHVKVLSAPGACKNWNEIHLSTSSTKKTKPMVSLT